MLVAPVSAFKVMNASLWVIGTGILFNLDWMSDVKCLRVPIAFLIYQF